MMEKNRLRPVVEILENYDIDCQPDLSVLDQDDFSKLSSLENMLPNTPATAALLSSESLNVVIHSGGIDLVRCLRRLVGGDEGEGKNHQVGLKKSRY